MFNLWDTGNARIFNFHKGPIHDFGACTVKQLLFGYDEALEKRVEQTFGNIYYIEADDATESAIDDTTSATDDADNINDDDSSRSNRLSSAFAAFYRKNLEQAGHAADAVGRRRRAGDLSLGSDPRRDHPGRGGNRR